MKKFILGNALLLAIVLLCSCQKDIDQFVPEPNQPVGPDSTWYATLNLGLPVMQLKQSLVLPFLQDSFVLNPGTVGAANLSSSLVCTIPFGTLVTATGNIANGVVQVASRLVKKKGDFIRMDLPGTSNNGLVLESGGSCFIQFRWNDSLLQVASGRNYQIKYPVSYHLANPQLYGLSGQLNNNNWTGISDSSLNTVDYLGQSATQQYQLFTNQQQWIGVYDTIQTGNSSQRIQAILPSNYTNGNTVAYLLIDQLNAVIPMIADYDVKQFYSPVINPGQTGKLVVISKQGNDYFLGYQTFTGNNNGTQGVTVTPTLSSLAEILAYLDTL